MLGEAIKELLKYWIVAEANHSDNVKEFIKHLRLYKNHVIKNEKIKVLRIIKSPELLVLLSNELIHESRKTILQDVYHRH